MNGLAAVRTTLGWTCLAAALLVPLVIAANSPLLAWREPIYIVAGLAGVIGLCVLLLQPLLAGGTLPGLSPRRASRWHRRLGMMLTIVVGVHVGGLWLTSPPDVIDALLFRSATPFSIWGVIAMWAIIGAALLALFRKRLRVRTWRTGHSALVSVTVASTAAHAMLIEGTMGSISKTMLCLFVLGATATVIIKRRAWRSLRRGA